jgi:site-specific recombinase XerD
VSNIIRLAGVPLTDPAWAAARRGLPAANSGLAFAPEVLSADEVAALMRQCNPRTPSGCRNRALIAVLWLAGLRDGEAVGRWFRPRDGAKGPQQPTRFFPGIGVGDVNAAEGLIRVTYGKGNRRAPYKSRTVAIDPGGMAFVELWLARRRELGIPRRVQLFCTIADDADRHGEVWRPLSGAYVRNLLKRLGLAAGLERRVHPHALRHTMAWDWAKAGVPMHVVQAQLGHESLATTGRYLAHIAPLNLADAARGLTWPEQVPAAHGVLPASAAA